METTMDDWDRIRAAGYDLNNNTWCRLCYGSYGPEYLVSHETDGTPKIGPACRYCIEMLANDLQRAG
jgi:hypothetical protein